MFLEWNIDLQIGAAVVSYYLPAYFSWLAQIDFINWLSSIRSLSCLWADRLLCLSVSICQLLGTKQIGLIFILFLSAPLPTREQIDCPVQIFLSARFSRPGRLSWIFILFYPLHFLPLGRWFTLIDCFYLPASLDQADRVDFHPLLSAPLPALEQIVCPVQMFLSAHFSRPSRLS